MRRHSPMQMADAAPPQLSVAVRKLWVAALEGARTDLRLAGRVAPQVSPNGPHRKGVSP